MSTVDKLVWLAIKQPTDTWYESLNLRGFDSDKEPGEREREQAIHLLTEAISTNGVRRMIRFANIAAAVASVCFALAVLLFSFGGCTICTVPGGLLALVGVPCCLAAGAVCVVYEILWGKAPLVSQFGMNCFQLTLVCCVVAASAFVAATSAGGTAIHEGNKYLLCDHSRVIREMSEAEYQDWQIVTVRFAFAVGLVFSMSLLTNLAERLHQQASGVSRKDTAGGAKDRAGSDGILQPELPNVAGLKSKFRR